MTILIEKKQLDRNKKMEFDYGVSNFKTSATILGNKKFKKKKKRSTLISLKIKNEMKPY